MSRLQQYGPKIENVQNLHRQFDQDEGKYENNSTMTVTSDRCGELFASIKSKVLSCELEANLNDNENNIETNQVNWMHPLEKDTESQDLQICNTNFHHHLEIDTKRDCDSSLPKRFLESSTQTEDIELKYEKQSPETLVAISAASLPPKCLAPKPLHVPAPPPPPPPLPQALTPLTMSKVSEKSVVNQTSLALPVSHQNTSSINSSAILSSASSFCPPPPPPMMPPGPPPLPLPSEERWWFKSDSKFQ